MFLGVRPRVSVILDDREQSSILINPQRAPWPLHHPLFSIAQSF